MEEDLTIRSLHIIRHILTNQNQSSTSTEDLSSTLIGQDGSHDSSAGDVIMHILYCLAGLIVVMLNSMIVHISRKTTEFRLLGLLAGCDVLFGLAFVSAGLGRLALVAYKESIGTHSIRIPALHCMLTPWFYLFQIGYFWPPIFVVLISGAQLSSVLWPMWYRREWPYYEKPLAVVFLMINLLLMIIAPTMVATSRQHVDVKVECYLIDATGVTYRIVASTIMITSGLIAGLVTIVTVYIANRQINTMNRELNVREYDVIRRQRHMRRVLGAIVICSLMLVIFPNFIRFLDDLGVMSNVGSIARRAFLLCYLTNSTLNFWLYFWLHKRFSRLVKRYAREAWRRAFYRVKNHEFNEENCGGSSVIFNNLGRRDTLENLDQMQIKSCQPTDTVHTL